MNLASLVVKYRRALLAFGTVLFTLATVPRCICGRDADAVFDGAEGALSSLPERVLVTRHSYATGNARFEGQSAVAIDQMTIMGARWKKRFMACAIDKTGYLVQRVRSGTCTPVAAPRRAARRGATGFALGSAAANRDRALFRRLYRTLGLFGVPAGAPLGRGFATGAGLGDALLLAMLSARPS